LLDQRNGHINCLDGLRGLAALWVLIGHAMLLSGWKLPVISRPDLAVDLFILLSGFLMVFHYELREDSEPWEQPSTWMTFWTRRFFRIAPLYYLLLTIALLMGPFIGEAREALAQIVPNTDTPPARYFDQGPDNILAHVTFVFGFLPHYSFRTPLPDWSIGLEMSFYAVFPFLMLLAKRLGWPAAAIGLALASCAIIKLFPGLARGFGEPSFLPLKLHIFLAGMTLAAARRQPPKLALIMLGLAVALSLIPIRSYPLALVARAGLVAGFAFLVHGPRVQATRTISTWVDDLLGAKPFKILGDLSYGAYLIHLLILIPVTAWSAAQGHPPVVRFGVGAAVTLAATYAFAWLGYRLVETPGIALGKFLLSPKLRPGPTTT
jgi:peptidoglycan/LPS O-acetylase OafA/YrhL